ncbi:MAG: DUF4442 domain-containing protein [Nannocystaceae bacterium]
MSASPFSLSRIVPSLDGDTNLVRVAWDKLSPAPGGKAVFSRLVGRMAAYTGTVGARVEILRPGYAEVSMRDRPAVRNHLRSIHAVALANLAELTGNIAVAYGMPDDARFIVAGLHMSYLKKARGTVRGVCEAPVPTTNAREEIDVHVRIIDAAGEVVATSILNTLIGPKPTRV